MRRSLSVKLSVTFIIPSYISWGGSGAQGTRLDISTLSESLAARMRSIFSCSESFHMFTVARTLIMLSGSYTPCCSML